MNNFIQVGAVCLLFPQVAVQLQPFTTIKPREWNIPNEGGAPKP